MIRFRNTLSSRCRTSTTKTSSIQGGGSQHAAISHLEGIATSTCCLDCSPSPCTMGSTTPDSHLALLAKRSVQSPADLRPIALTRGLGKALGHSSPKQDHRCSPPYAGGPFWPTYQTGESKRPYTLLLTFAPPFVMFATPGPWASLAGQQRPGLCGGLLFSLEFREAFDRLSRTALRKGLQLCHCPDKIIELFLHWLDQAQYHVHHQGNTPSPRHVV